jgi:hypothetical protein
MRRTSRAIGLALLVLASACSDSGTTTTTPAPITGPFTDIFTSIIYPGGFSAHSFSATDAGTITVTLTNAGPPNNVVMGLGIGVPNFGPGCSLTTSVNVPAGPAPQITIAADAGSYCIAIFDAGNNIPTGEAFSITTVHP